MIRYLKITLTDGTRFILRVTGESPRLISGLEVDADGEEIVPRAVNPEGRPYHQRERHLDRGTIKKAVEMRMNNKYATLEVAPQGERKSGSQLHAEIADALRARQALLETLARNPGATEASVRSYLRGEFGETTVLDNALTIGTVVRKASRLYRKEDV